MPNLYLYATVDAQTTMLGKGVFKKRLPFDGNGAESAVINATERRFVRLWADTDCQVEIAVNPIVDVDSLPLGAKNPEVLPVEPGETIRVRTVIP